MFTNVLINCLSKRYSSLLRKTTYSSKYLFLNAQNTLTSTAKTKELTCTPKIINELLLKYSENNHAYRVMHANRLYENTLCKPIQTASYKLEESDFKNLLYRNWRAETATNIVEAFKQACGFSKENNISISDHRFDKLVDGLMDRCQDLTDAELAELLGCLREYPVPENISAHNFHDVWSCLDDVCSGRHHKWSVGTLLLFADHWYQLGLCRYSDYIKDCIKRLSRKVRHLTGPELVQALFLINVCRKSWDMFAFECQLEKHIDSLSTDELGIVSMSFFKTEAPIKGSFLLAQMLQKLLSESKTVNEITLSAILKVVRYSPHLPLVDLIEELLNKLVPEVDRLSVLCCVHIALAGTNAQHFHPQILTKISEKFLSNMEMARLKDLERLTFALSLFNFNPPTSRSIYDAIRQEISNPERASEINKFPKCLACCIYYLSLQQIYPYDLISRVLDRDFLKNTYGPNKTRIGREILFLDSTLEIDCPDYSGNKLDEALRGKMARWSQDQIPNRNMKKKFSAGDRLMLDVIETTEQVLGGKDYIHVDFILPHFQRADVIICKDKEGNPVKLDDMKTNPYGNIMYAEKNGHSWYAIIVASWNSYVRGTVEPTGVLATKMRQLTSIGYTPVMVPWHEFANLPQQQKEEYISRKLRY